MDGEIFEGLFTNSYLQQGTIIYLNGDVVEGTFRRNLLNGTGKITYDKGKGKVLAGTFKNGELIQGTITYPNGVVIEGNFEEDKLNGQGKLILPHNKITLSDEVIYNHEGPSGSTAIVEGNFEDGKLNGKGKISILYGGIVDIIYEGTFEDSQLTGREM